MSCRHHSKVDVSVSAHRSEAVNARWCATCGALWVRGDGWKLPVTLEDSQGYLYELPALGVPKKAVLQNRGAIESRVYDITRRGDLIRKGYVEIPLARRP